MPRGTTKSRYLSLLEVAQLLGLDPALPATTRRLRVRRLFRSFEARDQVTYLHKNGGPTSPLKVCVDDLHLLDPWSPSTVQAIRNDVDAVSDSHNRLKRRVNALEEFAEKASAYLRQLGQAGSKLDPKPVH